MAGARMKKSPIRLSFIGIAVMFLLAGCNWNGSSDERERQEKTREEVAKATERAKPALEDAGRKIGAAAKEAADEAQAAAEGVKQGWDRGGHRLVNINVATESELTELPGIGARDARRIVDGRPYQDKHDVVVKGAISETSYEKIRDRITSK
jgi:DNA uptake protein ComE-like DNA-binding protein